MAVMSWGHPLDAVLWLARALLTRSRELDAGDTVTTGTCTGILQVLPGQTLEADLGAFWTGQRRLCVIREGGPEWLGTSASAMMV
jgi:2-keto-4-pentenoate hydratase